MKKKDIVLKNLEIDEINIINNCLNEVCNGFYLKEFEKKIGATKEYTSNLLELINNKLNFNNSSTHELTKDDLTIIINAINEVCKEFDDWEFDTRLGFYREEVCQLKDKLVHIVNLQ